MKNIRCTNLKEAGVTLVALVVTIIVLLILAGVTLTLALSNNGVMDRARYASNTWANATKNDVKMFEKIDQQISELSNFSGGGSGNSGIIVNHNGTQIDLSQVSASQISNYYGDYVVNYNKGATYQLFYVDTAGDFGNAGRIYLQATADSNRVINSDHTSVSEIGDLITNTNSLLYKLNPSLSSKYGSNISQLANPDSNLKWTAYMCNELKWRDYDLDGDGTDIYAIGGIPVEMFCKSYNARIQPNTEFDAEAFNDNNVYGYLYRPANGKCEYIIDEYGENTDNANYALSTSCDGMYYENECALSSPSYFTTYICYLINNRLDSYYPYGDKSTKLRPLVSIPADFKL